MKTSIKNSAKLSASLIASVLVLSCGGDVGTDNGNMRVQQKIDGYNRELISAPDGWILEINTALGGIHTLWAGFEEGGRVEMYFDYVEYYRELNTTSYESTYRIKPLQLPTLSFDTYSFLSIFADPNQLNNGAGQTGTGLIADFEYEILRYHNDEFTLSGLKNGQAATMRKATPQEHSNIVGGILMANVDQAPVYQPCFHVFTYNGVKYDFVSNGRKTAFLWMEGGEPSMQVQGSKIDMDGNIIMMEPLLLGQVEIPYFTKTDEGYSANLGSEVLRITGGVAPAVSLFGNKPSDINYGCYMSNSMQNMWSSEFFFTYRQALQNLFYWTIENYGFGYYIQYVFFTFYGDGSLGLNIYYSLYMNGSLGSDTYVLFFYYDQCLRNPDGSWTTGSEYHPLIEDDKTTQDAQPLVAPLLDYFKGRQFFFKAWPAVASNGKPMMAFVPVSDRQSGTAVGMPMNP